MGKKKRHFQFDDGKSRKFWEIEIDGASHTVRFGRIGTDGQKKTKEFASAAEARKSSDRLIQQKTKKGYRELSPTRKGTEATRPDTVKALWRRIETWLAEHAPTQAKSLAKGATAAQAQKLESQLGVTLSRDFRESCLIHDGQKEECDFIPDGFGTFYLLRIKDIPKEWKLWNDLNDSGEFEDESATPDKGVTGDWWNRGWIPFASNGGGDHLCIDLAPAKGGKVGQIIKMQHDHTDRNLLAPSFAAWLGKLADALERGELNDFLE